MLIPFDFPHFNPTPTLSLPLKGREVVEFLSLKEKGDRYVPPPKGREMIVFLPLPPVPPY